MECCGRPNRSDTHLSVEEEAKLEEKTRDYFDELAPKRHTKPQRSEYSSKYIDDISNTNLNSKEDSIPEMVEFQRLQNEPPLQKLADNGTQETEEFVETEYYKDLNCVGKQHHTTGTGFIKVENKSESNFHIEPDTDNSCHHSCICNPATNDWIPAATSVENSVSEKPNRSDN
ncbi:Maternal effect embryo arrest 59 [Quillaja saponaria]|uniref:Maternal effect embryo arrest 59 n=1 Tax=Quillaja saponaria TaxID=32244 RepID=A0AAD7PQT2_QUISA|nr:Maternal effect embryo arrest 59 [Quillaja saponaria]